MIQPPCSKDTMQMYRNCFSTPAGRAVLANLLEWLGFHAIALGDEDRIRRNVACELLMRCGIYELDTVSSLDKTTDWERVLYAGNGSEQNRIE